MEQEELDDTLWEELRDEIDLPEEDPYEELYEEPKQGLRHFKMDKVIRRK
jgi:hypothetical protein